MKRIIAILLCLLSIHAVFAQNASEDITPYLEKIAKMIDEQGTQKVADLLTDGDLGKLASLLQSRDKDKLSQLLAKKTGAVESKASSSSTPATSKNVKSVKIAKGIVFEGEVIKKVPTGYGTLNCCGITITGNFDGNNIFDAVLDISGRTYHYQKTIGVDSHFIDRESFSKIEGEFQYIIDTESSQVTLSLNRCNIKGSTVELGKFVMEYDKEMKGFKYDLPNTYLLYLAAPKKEYNDLISLLGIEKESYITNYLFRIKKGEFCMSSLSGSSTYGQEYVDILSFNDKGVVLKTCKDGSHFNILSNAGDSILLHKDGRDYKVDYARIFSDKGIAFEFPYNNATISLKHDFRLPIYYSNGDKYVGDSYIDLINDYYDDVKLLMILKCAGAGNFKYRNGKFYSHTGEVVEYVNGMTKDEYDRQQEEKNAKLRKQREDEALAEKQKEEARFNALVKKYGVKYAQKIIDKEPCVGMTMAMFKEIKELENYAWELYHDDGRRQIYKCKGFRTTFVTLVDGKVVAVDYR